MFPIICDSPEELEAKIASCTEQPATAGDERTEGALTVIPVDSAGITFVTLLDGTVLYLLGTCPSCARKHKVTPHEGPGYGTGPRPAYRHLRRKLDQPTRGPVARWLRRTFACGCQVRG